MPLPQRPQPASRNASAIDASIRVKSAHSLAPTRIPCNIDSSLLLQNKRDKPPGDAYASSPGEPIDIHARNLIGSTRSESIYVITHTLSVSEPVLPSPFDTVPPEWLASTETGPPGSRGPHAPPHQDPGAVPHAAAAPHRSCGSSRASACSRVRSSGGTSFEGHPLLEGTPAPGDLAAWPWIDFDPPALDRLLEQPASRNASAIGCSATPAGAPRPCSGPPSSKCAGHRRQYLIQSLCRTLKRLAADVVVRPVLDAGLREPESALYSQIRTF